MNIYYIEPESLDVAFNLIYKHYATKQNVPNYRYEISGIAKLTGVLTGVRENRFYPTILDKASYLLIQVNTGHFFSNGNKRLALVLTDIFLGINKLRLKGLFKNNNELDKKDYQRILQELFPLCNKFEDQYDFTPADFAGYNLSIIIADNKKYVANFDELKNKIKIFLETSVTQWAGVFSN